MSQFILYEFINFQQKDMKCILTEKYCMYFRLLKQSRGSKLMRDIFVYAGELLTPVLQLPSVWQGSEVQPLPAVQSAASKAF